MDLLDLRKMIQNMTDEQLQAVLMEVRQNRRTPVARTSAPKKRAEPKPKATPELGLNELIALAKDNPEMREKLVQALLGGKK